MTGEPQIHPGETDEFAFHAAENPLPEAVDVAIVGGGIIGSSAAYFLAQAACRPRCSRRAASPASNRDATGAGCASNAARRSNCR